MLALLTAEDMLYADGVYHCCECKEWDACVHCAGSAEHEPAHKSKKEKDEKPKSETTEGEKTEKKNEEKKQMKKDEEEEMKEEMTKEKSPAAEEELEIAAFAEKNSKSEKTEKKEKKAKSLVPAVAVAAASCRDLPRYRPFACHVASADHCETPGRIDEFCIINDGFCIINDELCIRNDGFSIKNDELCIRNDEFSIKNDDCFNSAGLRAHRPVPAHSGGPAA